MAYRWFAVAALCCMILSFVDLALAAEPPAKLKLLIVDGQNNHSWKDTTPILKQALEASGLFTVDVATSPAKGQDQSGFVPKFADYQVVVSNYNGDPWCPAAKAAFVDFVKNGGGFVVVHAADNSFPEWPEYNAMIGLGGWGGRSEKSGPYLRLRDGKFVKDTTAGRGGSHGKKHAYAVTTIDAKHPITAGLPEKWLHADDELYDRLRGPAENVEVLAASFSDPATGGTGEFEPSLFTIQYGKGRVFHTTLGHDTTAMRCAGFQTTLQRGAEWVATGKVTVPVPADFPPSNSISVRK